ncbi:MULTISPECIES: Na+/H+ antiporter [Paenibacillus]|uniref:Na+/H+ antiporter n=1 Tax=Paenibacillus odorifer TaxID=189426 RepID=A0A1R0X651_9BACL|nr:MULTISPECIES: Na+/H+ antiporter [Paenibacillus]AIQ73863.1 sodium:proton symporter [Paenibacillus odorifer]ETT49270.1 Na+/H+ antiporter [Paenibacillus sp. FSL H8-237]MEC0130687.1 Na+/H+ antiporter [Paenibacillus odorifer]MEC0220893.1 Na+/H+ antiporter [Paenibacillus odorifer]OMC97042.1 Na+/H+ antiporter [Paenibacillus odorifer]
METFLVVLVLLGLIAISNIINRFIPFVPIPLIQIGLGVVVVLLPLGIHMSLEPELFFVLFIAPLLFNDGKRTPRNELWNLRAPILMLALGLVFATVLIAGYSINWMIPTIPLAAAFALAAILSPTDAVAVSAIAGRVHLPKSIHRILEGESLMNDASGLVAFNFAIAAAVTGIFSLPKASISFVIIALGGLIVGAILAFLLIRFSVFIRRLGMEDITVHVLLQILTPFIVYLISEEIGVSGILAVVAAGIIHAVEKDRAVSPQYKLQLVSASTWSVLLYILNGLVFLILGLSIPDVIEVIYRDTAVDNLMVIGYVLAITLLLFVLRFIWVYVFSLAGAGLQKMEKSSIKSMLILTISGVRGAVTLAGAFSIPFVLGDGSPFPERDLIIFIAAGVILMSLLIASIFLPILAGKEEPVAEPGDTEVEQAAKSKVVAAGITLLQSMMTEESKESALPALSEFKEKVYSLNREDQANDPALENFRRLGVEARIVGLHAERKELSQLLANNEIPASVALKMEEFLDHSEVFLARSLNSQIRISITEIRRLFAGMFSGQNEGEASQLMLQQAECARKAKISMSHAAIAAINASKNENNRKAAEKVADSYEKLISRLQQGQGWTKDGLVDDQKLELKLKAIQEQRDKVQQMYQDGTINRKLAGKLRKFVDHLETSIWED